MDFLDPLEWERTYFKPTVAEKINSFSRWSSIKLVASQRNHQIILRLRNSVAFFTAGNFHQFRTLSSTRALPGDEPTGV